MTKQLKMSKIISCWILIQNKIINFKVKKNSIFNFSMHKYLMILSFKIIYLPTPIFVYSNKNIEKFNQKNIFFNSYKWLTLYLFF